MSKEIFSYVKLKDVADVEISSVDKKCSENETEISLCNFVDVYYNWAITERKADSFMKATAKQSEIDRFSLRKGQVAITKDSETKYDIGVATYIADDFDNILLGYHCALITPKENKLSGKYLNAFFHTKFVQKYFELNATGSGQRFTLSLDVIKDMPIYLPSLSKQKEIAEIFSKIDRKIELNETINDNLEQQAQMLYEYWFVQFDFPDKYGKPYKKSGNQMIYNHALKMDIPLGWSVGTLSDIANITMGQSPEGESYNENGNGIEFFQGSTDFGIFFPTTRVYTTKPKRMSKENDILLSVRAPVGTMNIAYQDCCIGRGLASIQGKTNNTTFVRHLLKSNKNFFDRINNAGTTFGAITKDILYEMPVIIPPTKIMMEYENVVAKSEATIRSAENEIRQLTHIRDYLLPLLLNGQLAMDI